MRTHQQGLLPPPEPAESAGLWGRRDFLTRVGWGATLVTLLGGFASFVRYLFPRVLSEPGTRFKAGYPHEFQVDQVSIRFAKSDKVWIIRTTEGFYTLLAQCTHLGCAPGWFEAEGKFKCFCHGSGFDKAGVNFEGPAPRPLDRVKITLADDGQILIDKGVTFGPGEWDKEGAFLRV